MKPGFLAARCALPLAALLAGCVTEGAGRGKPGPSAAKVLADIGKPERAPEGTLSGPVATPSRSPVANTRIVVQVKPLGTVPHDGQTLPVVSPDGRFLATQAGLPPAWPTVLAQDDASPASATNILVYDLTKQPAAELTPSNRPPAGCILGRGADTTGYLVESPRPDGSRWIGHTDWLTGNTRWLVSDAGVAAHAALGSTGLLAYSHRAPKSSRAEIVVQSRDGRRDAFVDPDGALVYPFFASDCRTLHCVRLSASGTEVISVLFDPAACKFGGISSRRRVSSDADLFAAYSMFASAQTPDLTTPPTILGYLEPRAKRVVELNLRDGSVSLMPEGSIAAARVPALAIDGAFVTTPAGLVFSPDPSSPYTTDGKPRPRPDPGRLFDAPHVVRPTPKNAESPMLLLGPVSGSTDPRVAVIAVYPAPDSEAVKPVK